MSSKNNNGSGQGLSGLGDRLRAAGDKHKGRQSAQPILPPERPEKEEQEVGKGNANGSDKSNDAGNGNGGGVDGGYDYLQTYNTMYQNDARFSPTGNKNYDIEQLWDHHYVILRLLAAGVKPAEIETITGWDKQTISNIRRSTKGREYLAKLHEEAEVDTTRVMNRIRSLAPQAVDVLEDIISGMDEEAATSDRRHAAKDILDRAGHLPPKSPDVAVLLTGEDIRELHTRRQHIRPDTLQEPEVETTEIEDVTEELVDKKDDGDNGKDDGDNLE